CELPRAGADRTAILVSEARLDSGRDPAQGFRQRGGGIFTSSSLIETINCRAKLTLMALLASCHVPAARSFVRKRVTPLGRLVPKAKPSSLWSTSFNPEGRQSPRTVMKVNASAGGQVERYQGRDEYGRLEQLRAGE